MSPLLLSATLLAAPLAAAADPPAPPASGGAGAEAQADAAFALAEKRQAIGEYAEAAEQHEAAARKYPAHAQAPGALTEAVTLRLGLGDLEGATQDAETFERLYGAKRAREGVKLKLTIGAYLVEKEAFPEVKGRLQRAMRQVDQAGDLGDQIEAHAWLGRSLAKLGDAKGAEREYAAVRALWKDPQAALKQFEAPGEAEAERLRRLGKALTAVGEATFFFAEKKRAEVDAIRFPGYRGPATREQILKHVSTKVPEWIRTKRPAIEAAERAYQEVLALQPAPPPRWVIASAARVGMMWGKFVAEFRAAPIPAEWRGSGQVAGQPGVTYDRIRALYYQQLDAASEPLKERAKAAFKVCVDYSAKYQYFDEYSRACEVWLAKNYGAEFSLIEELRPAMGGSGWSLRPSPLDEPSPGT